jgi:hypothetical protein
MSAPPKAILVTSTPWNGVCSKAPDVTSPVFIIPENEPAQAWIAMSNDPFIGNPLGPTFKIDVREKF